MNLKEAKIMLEKINRLYDSMTIDSKIDPFEQELMLSYIKKMYVAFSANGEPLNVVPSRKQEVKQQTTVEEKPKPKVIRRVTVDPPTPVAPPPAPAPEPTPEPEEIEIAEDITEEVITPAPAPKPKPKPAPKPAPTPPPAPPVSKAAPANEEVEELFEDAGGKELSERLASLPIRDLTKAMGLNERILTVNELFGKDQQAFTTSMNVMNTMGSFDEAKKFLTECAQKYDWTAGNKKKKAKVFIKLVRRRYK
ncbi:MAG: hypothetical protein AB8F74_23165 [Saprospiraceae bacterium]